MPNYALHTLDIAIILLSIFIVTIIPYLINRINRKKSKEQYLMASRKLHWLPLSLASVAAGFSSISLMGIPGFVMAYDLRYLPSLFTGIFSIFIVYFFILPFFYKLNLVSIYEYMENRFSPSIRYIASIMFILTKLAYLAAVIYTPALAISAITGINIKTIIVITGFLTTCYTFLGGMEGVIWTGLVQYFMIVAGLVVPIAFFAFGSDTGNLSSFWHIAAEAGKTRTFDFSLNFHATTIWVLILNSTFMGVACMCNDQSNIQRFLAAKSIKDACKGYIFSMIFGAPIVLGLYFIGVWMYGFFTLNELPANIASNSDMIFPYFSGRYLPSGAAGIVFAGIFAAGMSTISSIVHSLTSSTMVDYFEKIKSPIIQKNYVGFSMFVSFIWGSLGTVLALYIMQLAATVIEVTVIAGSFFAAPLGGIYFLGIFTKRANTTGAICGGISGIIITFLSYFLNKYDIIKIDFNWYAVLGITSTYLIGYTISIIFPAKKQPVDTMETDVNLKINLKQ